MGELATLQTIALIRKRRNVVLYIKTMAGAAIGNGLNFSLNGDTRIVAGPFTGETYGHVLRNHTGYAISLFSKPINEILLMLPFVLWCVHKLSL